MGPGMEKSSQRGIADPPMFSPDKDYYSWRKDVANWVELIKVGAEEGEDKLYKTVYKTVGRQLYCRGLPQAQKSVVDHAQEVEGSTSSRSFQLLVHNLLHGCNLFCL